MAAVVAISVNDRNNFVPASSETSPKTLLATLPTASIEPTADPVQRPEDWYEGEPATYFQPVSAVDAIQVSDLAINEGLSQDWENILVMGNDSRSNSGYGLTDTILILSINKNTSEMKITSLLRDTMVQFPGVTELRKLSTACYYGGPKLAMRAVNEYFKMNISRYVVINMNDFVAFIDKLGGVPLSLTQEEVDTANEILQRQNKRLNSDQAPVPLLQFSQESQPLNGQQALAYARVRSIDNDKMRVARQQNLLQAMITTVLNQSTTEIISTASEMSELLESNIPLEDMLSLSTHAFKLSKDKIQMQILPAENTYTSELNNNNVWNILPDFSKNSKLLQEFIYGKTGSTEQPPQESTFETPSATEVVK